MKSASTGKQGSSYRLMKIKLYIGIFIILASFGTVLLLGNFSRGTLASLIAFVRVESGYSRNQQSAIFELQRYCQTGNEEDYKEFIEHMTGATAYKTARAELEKLHPDFSVVYENAKKGGSREEDIGGLIFIYKKFRNFAYMDKLVALWAETDALNEQLMELGATVRQTREAGEAAPKTINDLTNKLKVLNDRTRIVEQEFAITSGEASRWVKGISATAMPAFVLLAMCICVGLLLLVRNVFKAIQKDRRELEDENWLRSGTVTLSDVMRDVFDVSEFASRVITHLCEYLGVPIGAMYITGDDDRLKMVGSYAYEKRKGLSNEFALGEGLVGQAALEKKYILMTRCPEDYVHVQSGIGAASPKNIIAYPLLKDGVVKGVVELGSLHEFSARDREFLSRVTPTIGIAVEAKQSRSKMAALLGRTQQQAQEPRVRRSGY